MYTNGNHTYGARRGREYAAGWSSRSSLSPRYGGAGQYPGQRYLHYVDRLLAGIREPHGCDATDPISSVFANQAANHALSSYHLASLIEQRRAMAEKHLSDIKWRLDDCLENRGLLTMLKLSGTEKRLTAVEKQILDLERQQRDIQIHLWRDTLDLQDLLLKERSEKLATERRMGLLRGGAYGS